MKNCTCPCEQCKKCVHSAEEWHPWKQSVFENIHFPSMGEMKTMNKDRKEKPKVAGLHISHGGFSVHDD